MPAFGSATLCAAGPPSAVLASASVSKLHGSTEPCAGAAPSAGVEPSADAEACAVASLAAAAVTSAFDVPAEACALLLLAEQEARHTQSAAKPTAMLAGRRVVAVIEISSY